MPSQNESLDPAMKTTPLTPEVRNWALRQHTDEEVIAGLQEAKEEAGPELADLIYELEQEIQASLSSIR
jgi:hypothetical protein